VRTVYPLLDGIDLLGLLDVLSYCRMPVSSGTLVYPETATFGMTAMVTCRQDNREKGCR